MKKSNIIAIIVVLVVIVGGVIAVSSTSKPKSEEHASMTPNSNATTETPTDPNTVLISNYKYSPTPLKIKIGTRITWTNRDIAKHTVTVDSGQPAGGPDSQLFGKNESFSFTFASVGTYKYHCSPHPYMHGVVEVTQ